MLSKRGRHYEKYFKEPTSNCREPAASFFFGVYSWLVMTFNYLILWVRVKVLGSVNSNHNHNPKHIYNPNPNPTLTLILTLTLNLLWP